MKSNGGPDQTARVDNQGSEMMSCTQESQAMQCPVCGLYNLEMNSVFYVVYDNEKRQEMG